VHHDGEIAGESVNRTLRVCSSGEKRMGGRDRRERARKGGKQRKVDEKRRGESRDDRRMIAKRTRPAGERAIGDAIKLSNDATSHQHVALSLPHILHICSFRSWPPRSRLIPSAFGEHGQDALAVSNYKAILCLWVRRITSSYASVKAGDGMVISSAKIIN
jgi:hypothetical protein